MSDTQLLHIGSLRISGTHVEELQDNRPILSINRADIRSIRLAHGFLARQPIFQIAFGIILTAISGYFFLAGLGELKAGIVQIWTILPIIFVGLGIWIVYDATKRGHFLLIFTPNSSHKLAIGDNVTPAELRTLSSELGLTKY